MATIAGTFPAGTAFAQDTTVGFIYVGSRDDYGYNQAHAQGAAALKKIPGIKVVEEEKVAETDAVEIDHRLHGFFNRVGLRDLLFLDDLEAGYLLERCGALRVGLIVAVVIARPDIDEADRRIRRGCGTCAESRAERQRGASLQEMSS